MEKILEKAANEGWQHVDKGFVCGNREEFVRGEERIAVTLQPISYQTANMTPAQLKVAMEADTLYMDDAECVEAIRAMPFEEQVHLTGLEREIFLLICQE